MNGSIDLEGINVVLPLSKGMEKGRTHVSERVSIRGRGPWQHKHV